MSDKNYIYQDEESGEAKVGGEPTEQEEYHGDQRDDESNGEFDPEKHPDNYIMRM